MARRITKNEKRMLDALEKIQKYCERYYDPRVIDKSSYIQDIWREANFAVHDVKCT